MTEDNVTKGKTVTNFESIIKKWINVSTRHIDLDSLLHELEPVIPEAHDLIQETQAQAQEYMTEQLKQGLNEIISSNELVEKMNQLDRIIQVAKTRDRVEHRVGPTPEQIIRGISCHEKEAKRKLLLDEFIKIKQENDLLMTKLSLLKNELSSKRTNITNDVEKFKKATMIANTIPKDELIDTMNKLDLISERG